MVRRGDVGRRPESPLRTMHEISEMDVGKIQPGLPSVIEAQAHALVRERLADVIGFAFMRQEAARGDPLDFAVGRIHERFVLLIQPA